MGAAQSVRSQRRMRLTGARCHLLQRFVARQGCNSPAGGSDAQGSPGSADSRRSSASSSSGSRSDSKRSRDDKGEDAPGDAEGRGGKEPRNGNAFFVTDEKGAPIRTELVVYAGLGNAEHVGRSISCRERFDLMVALYPKTDGHRSEVKQIARDNHLHHEVIRQRDGVINDFLNKPLLRPGQRVALDLAGLHIASEDASGVDISVGLDPEPPPEPEIRFLSCRAPERAPHDSKCWSARIHLQYTPQASNQRVPDCAHTDQDGNRTIAAR